MFVECAAGILQLLLDQRSVLVDAQLNEVPPCLNEVAAACAMNALNSVEATDCKSVPLVI